jgi:hypothetical protein
VNTLGYLTQDEILGYCTFPGVTLDTVASASVLIDAYEGSTFLSKEYTEPAKLLKKRTPYGDVYKGKLKHLPRVEVTSVTSYTPGPFGGEQLVTYDVGRLRFDEDIMPYFTFTMQAFSIHSIFLTPPPYQLIVSYKAGYAVIPEELKRATGMLADNLKRNGGLFKWTSRDDFDVKITLADDGIFTREIKQIIDLVKLS